MRAQSVTGNSMLEFVFIVMFPRARGVQQQSKAGVIITLLSIYYYYYD
jgi:hypothetical protein